MSVLLRSFVTLMIFASGVAHADTCVPTGGGSGDCINIGCAPADLKSNIKTTDAVLVDLANSNDFRSAVQFRSRLKDILKENDPTMRFKKYLALVGVDASDRTQVANFVGQREPSASQIALLVTNAGLTDHQARSMIQSLDKALRGDLN